MRLRRPHLATARSGRDRALAAAPRRSMYAYEVIDADGRRRNGKMEATSRDAVLVALRKPGRSILSVSEPKGPGIDIYKMIPGLSRFKAKPSVMADWARRFHQLLRSGLTVTKALDTLAEGYGDDYLGGVCRDLADQVAAGTGLATAMEDHREVFSEMIVAYISTAEATGTLTDTTERLARMLDKRASIDRRVRSVATYPVLVLGFITVVVAALLKFVVPRFAAIYSQFDATLPLVTRLLMQYSGLMLFFLMTIVAALGAVIVLKRSGRLPARFALRWERATHRLPIFGRILRKLTLYRWTSVLAGSIAAGLQLPAGIELAGRAAGAEQYRTIAPALADTIVSGRPLSTSMAEHGDLFTPEMRAMVLTGERSGELDTMLDSVARTLEEDIDATIAGLGGKVEVALLVTLVVVVGAILIALYLPVLSIAQVALRTLKDV